MTQNFKSKLEDPQTQDSPSKLYSLQDEINKALKESQAEKNKIISTQKLYSTCSLIGLASSFLLFNPFKNIEGLYFCLAFAGLYTHDILRKKNKLNTLNNSVLLSVAKKDNCFNLSQEQVKYMQKLNSNTTYAEFIYLIATTITFGAMLAGKLSPHIAALTYALISNSTIFYSKTQTNEIQKVLTSNLPKGITFNHKQNEHS